MSGATLSAPRNDFSLEAEEAAIAPKRQAGSILSTKECGENSQFRQPVPGIGPTVWQKTAFSRFPPVHRAGFEGPLGVDSGQSEEQLHI
jgi:hypothetical protein